MKQILIVDDYEAVRYLLRVKLEMCGYVCEEVGNGLEGLEILQVKQFDLVITDNQMPVMTGLQMLQALTEIPKVQRPPVILLTGHPSNELSLAAQRAGACAMFDKPYDEQKLMSEITRILRQPHELLTSCLSSYHSSAHVEW